MARKPASRRPAAARKPARRRGGAASRKAAPKRTAKTRAKTGGQGSGLQALADRVTGFFGKGGSNGGKRKTTRRKTAASKTASSKTASASRKSTAASPARRPARKPARRAPARRRTGSGNGGWRVAGSILFHLSFAGFAGLAVLIGAVYHYSRDLPSLDALDAMQRPAQITIVDRNGDFVTRYGQLHGKPVDAGSLPPHVVQAFLATEDRNFYHHMGVNPVAILRALIVNVRHGGVRQGGSTITQQFAKNVFLTPERTMKRKVQEALLAMQLEMEYSKNEILSFYLNNVYFGAGAHGLTAASERYFEKRPEELSVGEAAMLAGLLKAPSRYSPSSSPDAARERARVVLDAMVDAGYLGPDSADDIKQGRIAAISQRRNPAPYATDHVMAELNLVLPQPRQDITIHTTIDLAAHRKAADAIAGIDALDLPVGADVQVAMVALERDGAIRVLIGGRDYTQSEYNRATHALRQPGSAFKPFVYLAALEDGRRPDDIVLDTPVELGNWSPSNYKDRYYGAVPMAEAMARSLNAAAIHLQEATGRDKVVAVARRLGFPGKIDPGAALALGVNEATPLQLAEAYLPFANEGVAVEPYAITSIYGADGKVLYARESVPGRAVVAQKDLIALNHMLRGVVDTGSGFRARLPGYVAMGKTGTTQESRDAWFAGHAGGVTGIVWLGRDDYTPMGENGEPVSGSGAPAVLWKELMLAALGDRPDVPYTPWEPQPQLPPIFERFRHLFTEDEPAGDSATPDRLAGAAAGPGQQRPVRGRLDRRRSMDALVTDVIREEEAADSLPEGDDLGRLLGEMSAGAEPETGG